MLFFSYRPDTIYPIRIQAVNAVGPGVFSSTTRLSTRPLPPAPPRCECVNATHNSLKLKWGDNKSSNTLLEPCQYTLEMEKSRNQYVSNYLLLLWIVIFFSTLKKIVKMSFSTFFSAKFDFWHFFAVQNSILTRNVDFQSFLFTSKNTY